MQHLALRAIRAYQRWLSPYKGFACAFRVHTGRDSCSAYGHRVISRFGVSAGMALLRRRLAACGAQHRLHAPSRQPHASLRQQAGFCDASCDVPTCDAPCDMPALDTACDVASCGCDLADLWPGKRKREDGDGEALQRALLLPENRPEE
ncbi:membrane protein insertion efficiency factor YidD [Duganella ginsengisoli]|uniref:Membrane protein insertion efficiency factor YidD n=1 Tax=Pseudoduganella ginsengisoli TaxID=1462440 RepID=A0A6L6PW89_9BURK|nr:membrane protein insertion efficiency factor YidD [Pseudoduganella ginsengisoli]